MMDDVMNLLNDENFADVELSPADESAIFLAAMQDACTPEEYNALVMENTTELALYGLLDDADIVTEAKKIVIKQTKQMNMNREQSKAALRIAKKKNTAEWKQYQKHRQAMLEAKGKIFAKEAPKAKQEAKKVLQNSKRKASAIPTTTGKTIQQKMDKKINEMEKKK